MISLLALSNRHDRRPSHDHRIKYSCGPLGYSICIKFKQPPDISIVNREARCEISVKLNIETNLNAEKKFTYFNQRLMGYGASQFSSVVYALLELVGKSSRINQATRVHTRMAKSII